MLAVPDLDKKIRMEVNVLDYTMGGILSMEYEMGSGGQWHIYQSH